jgi:hypothetical protein
LYQEAVHLAEDGNIAHMPVLSAADVHRAYKLCGIHPEYVRGKMEKKRASRAVVDKNLILDEKKQMLYTDVMHIDSSKLLVTVCEPLQLTLQCKIERETQQVLIGMTLQGQLELLHSRGFIPMIVHTDPQSASRALTTQFPGVIIDVGGAGDYVSKVDVKIRSIKELYRSVKAGLPWKLPPTLVKDLVMYAVSHINICHTTALNVNVCPKVLFTGLCVNYKKELSLAFGDYAEVYDGMDNMAHSHSVPCIALYLCNNMTGSWIFLNLSTKQYIRHSQWQKMQTTEAIISQMSAFDPEPIRQLPVIQQEVLEREERPEPVGEQTAAVPATETGPVSTVPGTQGLEEPTVEVTGTEEELPELVPQEPDESDDEAEDDDIEQEEEDDVPQVRHSTRIVGGVRKPDRYAMVTKLRKEKEKDEKRKEAIEKAEVDEVQMLLVGLQALEPVRREDIGDADVHNSHLLTVEKFTADGTHDKFKYGSYTLAPYVFGSSCIQFYVCHGEDRREGHVRTD